MPEQQETSFPSNAIYTKDVELLNANERVSHLAILIHEQQYHQSMEREKKNNKQTHTTYKYSGISAV